MKVINEQYIQDSDDILQKLINIWSLFLIYELRLFTSKTSTNFETMIIFTWISVQTNVKTDRQTIFKFSDGYTINNSITTKTMFSTKIIYGNWTTNSKVMVEQRLKKDFDVTLGKVFSI